MGKIIGLNGNSIDPLAIAIRNALEADGSVSQSLESLTVSVDEWRRSARAVARELGRTVEPVVSSDAVHAALRDWPANERERLIHERSLRDAVDAISLSDEVLEPIAPCPVCGSEREWRPGTRIEQRGSTVCPSCRLVEL
jgi:predicted RNA-binding protein Jag